MERVRYEMTEDQLEKLIKRCRPTPVMLIGGHNTGASAQENANRAWEALGLEMGFDHMTVMPVGGESTKVFTAIPKEAK